MEDIIKLKSRGGIENYLKKIKKKDGGESKTYVLKSEVSVIRAGFIDDIHRFIDPSGGPMIVEGRVLEEANAVVQSINSIKGYGHVITFE